MAQTRSRLTRREEDVLAGIVRGLTAAEQAVELGVARTTIVWHRRMLYRTLGVPGQEEALLEAIRRGWATAGREWRGVEG